MKWLVETGTDGGWRRLEASLEVGGEGRSAETGMIPTVDQRPGSSASAANPVDGGGFAGGCRGWTVALPGARIARPQDPNGCPFLSSAIMNWLVETGTDGGWRRWLAALEADGEGRSAETGMIPTVDQRPGSSALAANPVDGGGFAGARRG